MRNIIKCTTDTEVYEAIGKGDYPKVEGDIYLTLAQDCCVNLSKGKPFVRIVGNKSPKIHIQGKASPTIVVQDGSSPYIFCLKSSRPQIYAFDKSSPRISCVRDSSTEVAAFDHSFPNVWSADKAKTLVRSYNDSTPHIISEGISPVRIITRGNSSPWVEHYSQVPLSLESCRGLPISIRQCSYTGEINVEGDLPVIRLISKDVQKITGAAKLLRLDSTDPLEWVQFFGLPIIDGEYVYLYKALDAYFGTLLEPGLTYTPGTTVEVSDWDPKVEWGKSIALTVNPQIAKSFYAIADKYVACKVKISEIYIPATDVEKILVPRVYEIFEVDIHGSRV